MQFLVGKRELPLTIRFARSFLLVQAGLFFMIALFSVLVNAIFGSGTSGPSTSTSAVAYEIGVTLVGALVVVLAVQLNRADVMWRNVTLGFEGVLAIMWVIVLVPNLSIDALSLIFQLGLCALISY